MNILRQSITMACLLGLCLILIACPGPGNGTPSENNIDITGQINASLCFPPNLSLSNIQHLLAQSGLPSLSESQALQLAQLSPCPADLSQLFNFNEQQAVAVDTDGSILANSPLDDNGVFNMTVPNTLFGVLLSETTASGVVCLQPLEYQRLSSNLLTTETFPALFGFETSNAQADLGSFNLNEFSANFAADLDTAPSTRLDPSANDFQAFIDGNYEQCDNPAALETPVNALFGFEIPEEAQAQAIDVDDFAFVLALRLLEDGRYEFVNAGTLDPQGNLDLTLVTDAADNLDDIRFIVADIGFFDERKLQFPPMPIFDTTLFGFEPGSISTSETHSIELGTINAPLAFVEAHVLTKEGTGVPDANVLGIIQQDNSLALNLVRTNEIGLWQMFIPPGADYSFVAFDQQDQVLGGRTINIDQPVRFGPSAADITVNTPPTITTFSASKTSGSAPLDVSFTLEVSDPDGDELSCEVDFGDGTMSSCSEPVQHTYQQGDFTATLWVADGVNTSTAQASISVEASQDAPPTAILTADVSSGDAPLTVTFDATDSFDDHGISKFTFDYGDGSEPEIITQGISSTHTYTQAGSFLATLTVEDGSGQTDSAELTITVSAENKPYRLFVGTVNFGGEFTGRRITIAKAHGPLFSVMVFDPAENVIFDHTFTFSEATSFGNTSFSSLPASGTYTAKATINDVLVEESISVDISQSLATLHTVTIEDLSDHSLGISFSAVSGAEAYRIVFLETLNGEPTAGFVADTITDTSYSFPRDFVEERQGQSFIVRVEALSVNADENTPSQQVNVSVGESNGATIPND